MKTDEFTRKIDDTNAPARLRGLVVVARLEEPETENEKGGMTFSIDMPDNPTPNEIGDMPDNPTPNEIGYFRLFVGEFIDKLQQEVKCTLTEREVTNG